MSFDARLLGERLRHAREAAGLSRAQVIAEVRRAGGRLTLQGLRDFEAGTRASIGPLLQAAEVMGLSPMDLFAGSSPTEDPLLQIERLATGAQGFSMLERELLLAATERIRHLRGLPRALPQALPSPQAPADLASALRDHLARGGAHALREIRSAPPFSGISEQRLLRLLNELRLSGEVSVVGVRPIRYFLRTVHPSDMQGALPLEPKGDGAHAEDSADRPG